MEKMIDFNTKKAPRSREIQTASVIVTQKSSKSMLLGLYSMSKFKIWNLLHTLQK